MNLEVIYMLTTVFYPSIGGRESHIHNISKELIKRGYKVKIIHPIIGLDRTTVYELNGIEVHTVAIGDESNQKKYEKYKKKSKGVLGYISGYLRKNYYNQFMSIIMNYIVTDVEKNKYTEEQIMIHQHDFISGYKLSKALGKKYTQIFTNHTGEFLFLKKLPFNKVVIKKLTKHFDYIISPSEELNQFKGIRSKDTYCYMPNGVDTSIFKSVEQRELDRLRKKYNLSIQGTIILCPRRWAPTKGIIYLVKAIDILVNQYEVNDFQVVFVGNDYMDYPEYKAEIESWIKDTSIEKYVKCLGNLAYEKMSEVTQLTDIVAIPSLMEAVSLSMLESMACGKFVIGSNTGGIPEVIQDGKNGFLTIKGDEQDIADKLKYIIEHKDDLKSIQEEAIKTVQRKYTWEVITNQIEEIYKEVWSRKYV